MHEIKQISSLQNALVKKFLLLQEKSRERKREEKFVLEGRKELQLAIKAGYHMETVLFYEGLISIDELNSLFKGGAPKPERITVSKEVFQKLAYRDSTGGIVAIGHCMKHDLESLVLNKKKPLILVAEAPEKPGNIGALLRTADAAKLDAVI
ncbi:MAG: RNA methyltransferase, partial [Flavobacteriales bacterium]